MKIAIRALLQKGLSKHTFKKTHTTKSLPPQCSIKLINAAPVKCNEPVYPAVPGQLWVTLERHHGVGGLAGSSEHQHQGNATDSRGKE